jgi:hypothetical protein
MAWFNLKNRLDKERFKRRCNQLYKEGATVELTAKKPKRTLSQNSYLHLILGWFAIETGNTIDYVKREYFKRLKNPDIFLYEKDDPYLGKIEVLRSSRDISTAEMTTAIERFRIWSSQAVGIDLPSPEDREFLWAIQTELERYKVYI